MNNNKWRGIMKIITAQHRTADNQIIWEEKKIINNILHSSGEAFLLKVLFTGDEELPEDWYIGLDSRSTLSVSQTMDDVSEPAGGGYERQAVASSGEFTIDETTSPTTVLGPIVTFTAVGGSFTVKNVIVSNAETDGELISSAQLTEERTVLDGQNLSIKVAFALSD